MNTRQSDGHDMGPEEVRYTERFERHKKENGLTDVKVATDGLKDATAESFFREMNWWMDQHEKAERGELPETTFKDIAPHRN